jgi:DNA-binding response OmpR family regulator
MERPADRSRARSRRPQHVVLFASSGDIGFYHELLRAAGFTVTNATDCTGALEAIHRDSTDLFVAVFDRTFPEECLTLCRRLRVGDQARRRPVVLAGVDVTEADLRAASEAGALALIVPHHDGTKLLAVISGILAAGRRAPLRAGAGEATPRIRGVR